MKAKGKISLLDKWKKKNKSNSINELKLPEGILPPLSWGQKRLWFLQQLHFDNPFYNYADVYHFQGNLNIEILSKSLELLTRRHEILRTNFVIEDGKIFQKIRNESSINIELTDLKSLTGAQKLKKANELAIEKARLPFNLENDNLVRVNIIQLKNNEHLFVLCMHHIITDKWSMRIFRDELSTIYNNLINNQQYTLPLLPIQYKDFAYWQVNQKINSESLVYWKNQLSGNLPFLNLPINRPRPSKLSYKGNYIEHPLPLKLSSDLKRVARETNTTLFVLMLAAFKVLLHKYSGQNDLLIGTPITNRDKVAFEKLIGFFNDTVVLRSKISEEASFINLVEQVKTTTLDAFSNKNVPFEMLVQELKIERHANINPIFQAMFLFHNVPPVPSFGKDLQFGHKPFDLGVAKFDLTLYISEESNNLSAIFEFASDLFHRSTIERIHQHYETLLRNIVRDPKQRIQTLEILTNEERNTLLNTWNETFVPTINTSNIHNLIEGNALNKPDQIALVFENQTMSYRVLNEKSTSVAKHLHKIGITPNALIGLYTDRSFDMIVGMLGILKAGGAYVPLDPEYPMERIRFMMEDTGMTVVLTQEHLVENIETRTIKAVIIEKTSCVNEEIELPKVQKTDTAYVIYTSGSTGKPKGVVVSHENLIHSTTARYDFYSKQPDAFLLLSSFAFDSSIVGLFWTLCYGGTLVLPKHRIEQDLEAMGNLIQKHQVSHTLLLPSLYNVILQHISIDKLESLNTIIVAGEACSSLLCQKHYELFPEHVSLYNEYGPTEASVWCIAHLIKATDAKGTIPIGKPIPNTQTYILDNYLQPVPIGVTGELFIGGAGITQGYLNRPKLTAERFIQNPFDPNSKLYKTGDLVKYRPDGIIDFLGRVDHQVKIRGFRIELGEIQAEIKQYNEVEEAVVMACAESSNPNENELMDETEILVEQLMDLEELEREHILATIENMEDAKSRFMLQEILRN